MLKTVAFLLLFAAGCFAQDTPPNATPPMNTMLNDALYSVNRFEEIATESKCSKITKAEFAASCKKLLNVISLNVKLSTRPALNRLLKEQKRSLTDLFELYQGLLGIVDCLDEMGQFLLDFTDSDPLAAHQAVAISEVDSKIKVLAANLASDIGTRIQVTETLLQVCDSTKQKK